MIFTAEIGSKFFSFFWDFGQLLRIIFATLFARLWHSSRERNSWSLTFDLVVGTVKEAFRSAPPSVRLIKRFVGESGANVPVPPRVASCEPVVFPPLRTFPGQEPIKADYPSRGGRQEMQLGRSPNYLFVSSFFTFHFLPEKRFGYGKISQLFDHNYREKKCAESALLFFVI